MARVLRLLFLICLFVVTPIEGAFAQNGTRVSEIRVEGVQRIEPDTVRTYLAIRVGDPFDADLVDQSLKQLFATNLFADVTLRRDGDRLVVRVVENPIVNRVQFEGARRLDAKSLESEVQLKSRQVFTRAKAQADQRRLLELYRRNGRFAATVEPKIIQLDQNRVDVVFEIEEGERTTVDKITFIGNRRFSDSTLRGVIQTIESRWYRFLSSDDTYDPDRVAFDRESLRRYYLKNGYLDFRVLSAIAELSPSGESFFLTFTLEEGQRFRYGAISVESMVREVDASTLRQLINLREGDWVDQEEVQAIVDRITEAIGTQGYAFSEVEPVIALDRETMTAAIKFEVREGPKVFVERIDIQGNVRTLDRVVRREFRLVEGDAFNSARLRRSQQRIRNLGFFSKVDVTNVPGSAPDRTVVNVELAEQSTGELTIGAGFSTSDGVLGEVSIRERNLLGSGLDARFAITYGARRQQYDLFFADPYFLDLPLRASMNLFRIERDQRDDTGFESRTTGATPSFRYNLTERLSHTVFYTYQVQNIFGIQPGASLFVVEQRGERSTSLIGQDFAYDALDNRIDPTDGYLLGAGTDVAGLGGDAKFLRVRTRADYYYPLFGETVLSLRGRASHILGIAGERVTIGDRFFPGSEVLKGFRLGGFGPRDRLANDALGGNTFYALIQEAQFSLGLPRELGLTGRVWNNVGSSFGLDGVSGPNITNSSALRGATGVGVSWRSPFGPIQIDLSLFPYLKQPSDRTEAIRFSFGTQLN